MPPASSGSKPGRKPKLELLRGGADMPAEVKTELEFGFHRAFPRGLQVDDTNPALWLRYRIGLRNDEYSDDGVTAKELVG